jgi:TatD DNase family protein
MLVDSHCHLQFINYTDLGMTEDEVVQNSIDNKIEHLLCVATHYDQISQLQAYANRYANLSISIGLHPDEAVDDATNHTDGALSKILLQYAKSDKKIIAIGETGLDYYRNDINKKIQQQRFIEHIEVAKECNKPLIIHTRMARTDTIAFLKEANASKVGGVFHCFTEDWDMAKQAIDLNFYISFSGILTFKNAVELQYVAKKVPLDRILVETDSPYLAPVPLRGKINQPTNVQYVAKFLAMLRNEPFENIAATTTDNFYRLFSI